jgi:hypothetical protein
MAEDLVVDGSVIVNDGSVIINKQGDGETLLQLNTNRRWAVRQSGEGAGTALELVSIGGGGNKAFLMTTTGRVVVNGGSLEVNRQGDGQTILLLNTDRRWAFRQLGSGAGTALELVSIGGGGNKNFVINTTGRVGIGTTTPRERLEVDGNILATGDVILSGADCAEDFNVADAKELDPGTVMVIGDEDELHPCTEAYDKRVAGILSGAGDYRPGVVLDRQETSCRRMPLALTGKAYCKVDAALAPIETGDLLTTAPVTGHAMKVVDPLKGFGAVIGKALRPHKSGRGLIPVLISLQ